VLGGNGDVDRALQVDGYEPRQVSGLEADWEGAYFEIEPA
jgi:hypothetical protein